MHPITPIIVIVAFCWPGSNMQIAFAIDTLHKTMHKSLIEIDSARFDATPLLTIDGYCYHLRVNALWEHASVRLTFVPSDDENDKSVN